MSKHLRQTDKGTENLDLSTLKPGYYLLHPAHADISVAIHVISAKAGQFWTLRACSSTSGWIHEALRDAAIQDIRPGTWIEISKEQFKFFTELWNR